MGQPGGAAKEGWTADRLWRRVLAPMGWSALFLGGSGLFLEHSGLLRRWVRTTLARRLALSEDELRLTDVDVAWTRRSLHLIGLELGGDVPDLALDDVQVVLTWSPRHGLRPERVVVDGGHLRISRALTARLESALPPRDDDVPGVAEGQVRTHPEVPELVLHDLALTLVPLEAEEWSAGVLELALADDPERATGELGLRLGGEWRPLTMRDGHAPRRIALAGSVSEGGLALSATAERWALDPESWPRHPWLDALRGLRPQGVVDLEARGQYAFGGRRPPRVELVAATHDGALRVPLTTAAGRTDLDVEAVALQSRVTFEPTSASDLWEAEAWSAEARLTARCLDTPLDVHARLGQHAGPGAIADAWARVPHLAVDERTRGVASRLGLDDLVEMLVPDGAVELGFGVAVPAAWSAARDGVQGLPQALVVRSHGGTSLAYVGGRNRAQDDVRNLGFPLRVREVQGHVTFVHRPGDIRSDRLGIHGVRGLTGSEPVFARGSLTSRPHQPRDDEGQIAIKPWFHLAVHGDGVPVDDDLRRAFQGLTGVQGCEELWPTYLPDGGRLGFDLRFERRPSLPRMSTELAVHIDGVGFRWRELPVPVLGVSGELALLVDPHAGGTFRVRATGTTPAARGRFELRGRTENHDDDPSTNLALFEADVQGLNLRSTDLRAVLETRHAELSGTLDELGANGWVDLLATHLRDPRDATTWVLVSTTDEGCRVQPRAFPMDTRNVHARVALASRAPSVEGRGAESRPEATAERVRAILAGEWTAGGAGIPLRARATADHGGAPRLSLSGAGIDVSNEGLLATIAGAVGSPDADVSRLKLAGTVDVAAEVLLAREDRPGDTGVPNAPPDSTVELYARLERLGIGGVDMLHDLHGPVRYRAREGVWRGDRLRAELGGTPVELSDLSFRRDGDALLLDSGLAARGLPIDREHLQYFLDANALRTLLDEFEASGWFDLTDGRVSLRSSAAGETGLGLAGRLSLHDVFVRIGLPIAIESAEEIDLDLRVENGRARARAQVRDLDGQVAGRRLANARMQLSYIDPRLTIEDFRGQFEGGVLRSLSTPGSSTSGFFAVDLEEPFPFSLAAQLVAVDVGKLLEGLFRSDFANEGSVDTELRLDGDLGRLTGIRGSGEFRLSDTSLWAIPVFQALFAQLGFDTTAVFSRMSSRFAIEDGVIDMSEISVKSDLLSLVGSGRLDFDGSLEHELQVRYGLIDRLGPLTRLLYQIQNSLLRISIQGDFSRPEVLVEGLFSQFFRRSSKELRLPLPEYGPLPVRF